jgi:hypothetical protein
MIPHRFLLDSMLSKGIPSRKKELPRQHVSPFKPRVEQTGEGGLLGRTAVDMHCVITGRRVKCPLYHRNREAMMHVSLIADAG